MGVLVAPLGRKIYSFVSKNRKSSRIFLKCKELMEISVTIILHSVVSTLSNLSQNYYSWFPHSCPFTKVFVKARILMTGKADVRRQTRPKRIIFSCSCVLLVWFYLLSVIKARQISCLYYSQTCVLYTKWPLYTFAENIRQLKISGSCPVTAIYRAVIYRFEFI